MFNIKHLGPNEKKQLVRYSREFVITVIVITRLDCIEVFNVRHSSHVANGLDQCFSTAGTCLGTGT